MSSKWTVWLRPYPQKGGFMKKLKIIGLFACVLLATTACKNKNSEGLNVLTTTYPISFLTEQIYGSGNISSVYPDGANVEEYNLTDKQIKEYSKNDIFIYNGLSNEQDIAKNLINSNRKLYIIDVAYGLKYNHGVEELWLSPNYYLMLAKTIKDNLQNFVNSKYAKEELEKNYNELSEKLSIMDADLRTIAKSAEDLNKNTLVVSSNMFKYLENYGFKIISLEEITNVNSIKNSFDNKTYTTLFMKDTDEKTNTITTLEKSGAKIITVKTMKTLTTEEKENNETYFTIMNEYIENIKNATLGD